MEMFLFLLFLLILSTSQFNLIKSEKNFEKTNSVEQITIDLKQQILKQKSDLKYFELYDYAMRNETKNESSQFIISSSRLYSNQLSQELVKKYFMILNQTKINFLSNRYDLCSNIKYCESAKMMSQSNESNFANTKMEINSNNHKCQFNLNFIIYMSRASKVATINQKHFSEIKSIKLNLLISDFEQGNLRFDKEIYDFKVYLNEESTNDKPANKSDDKKSVGSNEFSISIGQVKANFESDSDMNRLVKYYLDFKDEDRSDLANLFRIDSESGLISLNKILLERFDLNKKRVEFYVDSIAQCNLMQKPLRNRTLVYVDIQNKEKIKPKVRLTNLIETKRLSESIECIRLRDKDLALSTISSQPETTESSSFSYATLNHSSVSMIALAQLIVEQDVEFSLDQIQINLIKIEPNEKYFQNQLKSNNIKIENLIDNIYVIYLVGAESFKQIFLNDIYKIQLELKNEKNDSILIDIYLCFDSFGSSSVEQQSITQMNESSERLGFNLNLIQFKRNVYKINSPILIGSSGDRIVKPSDNQAVILEAFRIDSNNSQNIEFYLKNSYDSDLFKLSLEKSTPNDLAYSNSSSSSSAQLTLINYNIKSQSIIDVGIEQLQYELICIAFDSNAQRQSTDEENGAFVLNKLNQDLSQIDQIYEKMSQSALINKMFLRFAAKILINTKLETLINDSSIYNYADLRDTSISEIQLIKFFVRSESLVKNSIIGHLPNIFDLETTYLLRFDSYQAEYIYYSYEFEESIDQSKNRQQLKLNETIENVSMNIECFKLNRFDGVLTLGMEFENCFSNKTNWPIKLRIYLNSMVDERLKIKLANLWIYDLKQMNSTESNESSSFNQINSNSVNLFYDYSKSKAETTESVSMSSMESSQLNQDELKLNIKKSSNQRNEFNLNFLINLNLTNRNSTTTTTSQLKDLPKFVRLVNLISNFRPNLTNVLQRPNDKPTTTTTTRGPSYSPLPPKAEQLGLDFTTKFEFIDLEESLNDLFYLDTKKNSIYLNLSKSIETNTQNKLNCFGLNLIAKNFIYLNSIKRKLVSFDYFKMNLCFLSEKIVNLNFFLNEERLTELSQSGDMSSIVIPLISSRDTNFADFQFLIKNQKEKLNLGFLWFCLLISFIVAPIVVIFLFGYFCSKRRNLSKFKRANLNKEFKFETRSSANRSPSTSSSPSSSPSSSDQTDSILKLKDHLTYNLNYGVYSLPATYQINKNFSNSFESSETSGGYTNQNCHSVILNIRNDLSLNKFNSIDQANLLRPAKLEQKIHNEILFSNASSSDSSNLIKISNNQIKTTTTAPGTTKDINKQETYNNGNNLTNETRERNRNIGSLIELYSSIIKLEKEPSDDHGIYCLATGTTSFSLSSNISSVTTSQFVDEEYNQIESNYELERNNYKFNGSDLIASLSPINQTRLSLLEMTPVLLKRKNNNFGAKIESKSIKEINSLIYNKSEETPSDFGRLSDQMKSWIITNYNINCVYSQNEQQMVNFDDDSANSSNLIQLDSNAECII